MAEPRERVGVAAGHRQALGEQDANGVGHVARVAVEGPGQLGDRAISGAVELPEDLGHQRHGT
jgi:hypothetical protein